MLKDSHECNYCHKKPGEATFKTKTDKSGKQYYVFLCVECFKIYERARQKLKTEERRRLNPPKPPLTPEERVKRNAEYFKKWYVANKEKQYKRVKDFERKSQEYILAIKESTTCPCGESHPATLDFHHVDRSQKLINIASIAKKGWSIKRISEEISKCEIICSNCHRKKHHEERMAARVAISN